MSEDDEEFKRICYQQFMGELPADYVFSCKMKAHLLDFWRWARTPSGIEAWVDGMFDKESDLPGVKFWIEESQRG